MKRPQLNFVIDAAAFIAFLALLSTGLVLRYRLPPGSGRLEAQGGGPEAEGRLIALVWGWTRHDWGDVHFWVALTLVAVLALHLFLHWRWIVCMVRGTESDASGWRFGVGLASLVALVGLAAAPTIAPTRQTTRGELRQSLDSDHATAPQWDYLRGSMTWDEVAADAGLPVEDLLERLGLPDDVSPQDRVGRSLRQANKHMSDLRRLLSDAEDAEAVNPHKESQP